MSLKSDAQSILSRLTTERDEMVTRLMKWAAINTGTYNLTGLAQLTEQVQVQLEPLTDHLQYVTVAPQAQVSPNGEIKEVPLAGVIVGQRRRRAPIQAVLSIHLDTVFPIDSPFQDCQCDEDTLWGPGVADAKGGLIVLLHALAALEHWVEVSGDESLGWTVILNSDEEIGSPGSRDVFARFGSGADFGLLFEPCLSNGHLIGQRKGSGNFEIIVRGKAAHAGRAFHQGRNAIVSAAKIAQRLHQLNGRWPDTTVNVAKIDGGGPSNVVPEMAVVRFNVRYPEIDLQKEMSTEFERLVHDADEGIRQSLHGGFFAPPKPLNLEYLNLLQTVQSCGKEIGIDLVWEATGGVCDGNRLAAVGVPNVDTMGVQGGHIHSHQEYMRIDSLVSRTQLTFLTLLARSRNAEEAGMRSGG